ncbi:MAG TPA: hypothetical protein VLW55_12215 [Burkholderiaceae bacterium]|jgi:hypothetical protein|nr:hypothetical protein [Burkholderiaceae bacterium]
MNEANAYKMFGVGLATGALVVGIAFTGKMLRPRACEPVVDVEYKRDGRDWVPQTVVRRPVRDGERCLLAETGS